MTDKSISLEYCIKVFYLERVDCHYISAAPYTLHNTPLYRGTTVEKTTDLDVMVYYIDMCSVSTLLR